MGPRGYIEIYRSLENQELYLSKKMILCRKTAQAIDIEWLTDSDMYSRFAIGIF